MLYQWRTSAKKYLEAALQSTSLAEPTRQWVNFTCFVERALYCLKTISKYFWRYKMPSVFFTFLFLFNICNKRFLLIDNSIPFFIKPSMRCWSCNGPTYQWAKLHQLCKCVMTKENLHARVSVNVCLTMSLCVSARQKNERTLLELCSRFDEKMPYTIRTWWQKSCIQPRDHHKPQTKALSQFSRCI